MAATAFAPVVRYIHRIAAVHASHLTDSELLDRFAERHDEEAFAILVHRHGRLVLGVCRRIVRDWHAAEDCFQAVFLVLATKAQSLRRTDSLGPWLHAVAHRVAQKARAQAFTRLRHEQNAVKDDAVEFEQEVLWHDLRPVLDDAIASLQKKYRIPFVLCYLQGRTITDVAHELGQPKGTVAAWLARAREQLRRRLVRRGIVVSGASLTLVLSDIPASAAVAAVLASSTISSAGLVAAGRAAVATSVSHQTAALLEGAIRSMFFAKTRVVFAVLSFVVFGIGLLGYHAMAAQQTPEPPKALAAKTKDKLTPAAKPAHSPVWCEVRVLVTDVDEKGEETVISHPILRTLDKQAATFTVGEVIGRVDNRPIHDIQCEVKLADAGNGKAYLWVDFYRYQRLPTPIHDTQIAGAFRQVRKLIKAGNEIEFELQLPIADGPKTRVKLATRLFTDKTMEEVELVPLALPDRSRNQGKDRD